VLEPIDTVNWYPRVMRKDFTVTINVSEGTSAKAGWNERAIMLGGVDVAVSLGDETVDAGSGGV